MVLLILGVGLWAGIHLIPSLAPGLKQDWKDKLGQQGYMGSFALCVAAALALITPVLSGSHSAQIDEGEVYGARLRYVF